MQEARGFKRDIGKDKLKNKQLKQDRKSAKEKRMDKLNSLLSNPKSWKFLEDAGYVQSSKVIAENVVQEMCDGTSSDIEEAITAALDFKVAIRISPHLERTGKEIEEDIFWCKQYGNK